MGDIGKPVREGELEPIRAPRREQAPSKPVTVPEREPVPA